MDRARHSLLREGDSQNDEEDYQEGESDSEDECKYESDPEERLRARVARFDVSDNESKMPIDVGDPNPIRSYVQTNIVSSSSSEFLKAKIKPEWHDEDEPIKILHPTEASKLYSKWLHFGIVPASKFDNPDDNEPYVEEFRLLADAYALGEFLLDNKFKNWVVDTLCRRLKGSHANAFFDAAPDMAHAIYDGTPAESPARRAMVNVFRACADSTQLSKLLPHMPGEFHCDLAIALASDRKAIALRSMKLYRCEYHQH